MPFHHPPTEGLVCPLAGFAQSHADQEIPGINLVYIADKSSAWVGDKVTFTLWLLNSTAEPLTDIRVNLRSLTNSRLDALQYKNQPRQPTMIHRVLAPHKSLSFTLIYVIELDDVIHPGMLVSALQTSLVSPSMGKLHSECDVMVNMGTTP